MPSPADRATLRFVRLLVEAGTARPSSNGTFRVAAGRRSATLATPAVKELVSAGVLALDGGTCRAQPGTKGWLRRQLLGAEGHASQHRQTVRRADGTEINLAESPLARLATAARGDAAPFLDAHHVEAGERIRRLVERAQLQPRLTMSYDPARAAGTRGGGPGDISAFAMDARRRLAEIVEGLPRDCAGVVLDVCGLLKGLQTIEGERGWPPRSAKLVLRIGLDHLARQFGLAPLAVGRQRGRLEGWMEAGARPALFCDSDEPA